MNGRDMTAFARLLAGIAAVLAGSWFVISCTGVPESRDGSRPLAAETRSVPRPEGQPIEGSLPRPLFLAEVVERDEPWDPEERTTFFVFDPSRPRDGFRKVYEGPGVQYCRFLTPLFGGVGIAMGEVDASSGKSSRRIFWFDLLGGKPGETVALEPGRDWTAGREMGFRTEDSIHRLDPLGGVLRSFPTDLSLDSLVGENLVLGVSPLDGAEHAVLLDLVAERLTDLGELPRALQTRGDYDEILPAGPAGRDGVGFVTGAPEDFALWYMPRGSHWRQVLRGIRIHKNFGGRAPWLPVAYLGDGRFAVSKTVKDVAPGDAKEFQLPPSLSTTLLVDGATGRVLEETKPIPYHGNPDLDIPEGWWSREAVEARRANEAASRAAALAGWSRGDGTWRSPGGIVTVSKEKEEESSASADGRWLAVYPRWAEEGPPASVPFRFVDATTGEETSCDPRLEKRAAYVNHGAWQVLASGPRSAGEIEEFSPAPRHPFHDPW